MRASQWQLFLAAAIVVMTALNAHAQTPAEVTEALSAGMRVRVRTTSDLRLTGRVFSIDESSLRVVDRHGLAIKLGREQITTVEVGLPRERGQGALRGAVIGGLAGGALGGLVYLTDRATKREDGLCGDLETGITRCTTGSEVVTVTFGGALIGASLGAIFPGERWHALRPAGLRLALGRPPGGGVGVRATLSF